MCAATIATQPQPGGITGPHDDELRGLYGPGSEAWRLNREATLLLGAGPRALLLQLAHPLVAEGVAQHSDFRADPWARLAGTLRSYLRIVYGTTGAAREEIRRLNALHRSIRGPIADPEARRLGDAYTARDPALSLWVHATLIDSTLVAVDAWLEPLDRRRRARFYAETRPIGRAFGIPDGLLPADVDAFDAYLADMLGADGPVHPTATARELAHAVLHPPLRPLVAHGPIARLVGPARPALERVAAAVPLAAYDWTLLPAVGLLPVRTRTEYGFRWGRREQLVAGWLTAAWRSARQGFPDSVRLFPQARAAERRLARRPPS